MSYKYALRYSPNIEHREEGYEKSDCSDKCGLTDCLLGISMILPDDGSYSQQIVISEHGKEKRGLNQSEIFRIWATLGLSLHDSGKLDGWEKELVKLYAHIVREAFKYAYSKEEMK
jgi:hypothetical protein